MASLISILALFTMTLLNLTYYNFNFLYQFGRISLDGLTKG